MTDLTKLPWYGGNKIPDSYLAKFIPKTKDDDLPWELRVFLNNMGDRKLNNGITTDHDAGNAG